MSIMWITVQIIMLSSNNECVEYFVIISSVQLSRNINSGNNMEDSVLLTDLC